MASSSAGLLVTCIALSFLVPLDWWVYTDSRSRERARRPVVARLGTIQISGPQTWLVWCAVLFVVAFPLYLVARRHD